MQSLKNYKLQRFQGKAFGKIHTSFLTMISISLFCCCENLFTHMNTWIIGKTLMKHYYYEKKLLQSLHHERCYWCRLQTKRVCKEFEIKYLLEYHDLYVPTDTLLLDDVFNNFWNMCLKVYMLYPALFLSATNLPWKAASKNQSKIRSINWYQHVINGRNRYLRLNISCHSLTRKS